MIRLAYVDDPLRVQAALTVKRGTVVVRGIRFEIDSRGAQAATLAAVIREGGDVTFEDCEFVQIDVPPGAPAPQGQTSAVVVRGLPGDSAGSTVPVSFQNCLFIRGQDAVTWTGPASIACRDCHFGEYASLFHGKADDRLGARPASSGRPEARVDLRQCCAFVVNGPVFALERAVGCHIQAQECVFTRPATSDEPADAVFVLQSGDAAGSLRYDGRHNVFHNLKALWMQEGRPPATTLAAFTEMIPARDDGSTEPTASPLKNEAPLKLLASDRPREAFALAQVRERPGEPATRVLVVDLESKRPAPGDYGDLAQAIRDARAGDVILLKCNGEIPLDPVRLEKAATDLTFRAAPGYHPLLTLGETHDSEVALFRIHDGRLRFEDLEFVLRPRRAATRKAQRDVQSVVQIGDVVLCTFVRCVFTLAPQAAEEARFAAVTLLDLRDVMKMGQAGSDKVPKLQFESCFVRGKGDLVAVPASRPLDLEARNSLIALAGSFLNVTGKGEDPPATPATHLTLVKVTTYLADHLVLLRARAEDGKSGKGLVPTEVSEATSCLFICGRNKSLVHLEGVDREDEIRRLFTVKTGDHTAYVNYSDLLDQRPRDPDSMAGRTYNDQQWQQFTQETAPVFGKAKPHIPADLSQALPAQFQIKPDELQNYGADLNQLPRPAANLAPEPAPEED